MVIFCLLLLGCGFRKPAAHEPVLWGTRAATKAEVFQRLEAAMKAEGLPIAKADRGSGTIVTDSFDVLPEYCDCGLNLLGEEYPGQRRGVMTVKVSQGDSTTVKFEFQTRLTILANQKILLCGSKGVLEQKLLGSLERR